MTEFGSESVPTLISRDRPCSKHFIRIAGGYAVGDTGNAYLFDLEEKEVSGLQELVEILSELEQENKVAIIRGACYEDPPLSPVRRILENFGPATRQWCLIDIDDVPIPEVYSDWVNHLPQLIETAIETLPEEFCSVDCWYQFSASMGIKEGKIRIHLWYWLSRKVSDTEMKAWLADSPVDLRLYHPIQMHFIAKPFFSNGALDPLPDNRSGLHRAGNGIDTVPVPEDLRERTAHYTSRPRHTRTGGIVEAQEIVRDPDSGLAVDGRERLLFELSNEITSELVRKTRNRAPAEDEIAERLWERFSEEADLSDGKWTKEDAKTKAQARYKELQEGTYTFTARGDSNTLFPTNEPYYKLELVSAEEGQGRLQEVLDKFFEAVDRGENLKKIISRP